MSKLADPASDAIEITPSDATIINCFSVHVGGVGDVAVETSKGTVLTFVGCAAGSTLPIKVVRVLATGTTATYLIGLCS